MPHYHTNTNMISILNKSLKFINKTRAEGKICFYRKSILQRQSTLVTFTDRIAKFKANSSQLKFKSCRYQTSAISIENDEYIRVILIISDTYMHSWSRRGLVGSVGLLDEKSGFESQARHQNKIRKVFVRRFPLSRFLAKTLRVNKIAMKSFSKNLSFGVDFKL